MRIRNFCAAATAWEAGHRIVDIWESRSPITDWREEALIAVGTILCIYVISWMADGIYLPDDPTKKAKDNA